MAKIGTGGGSYKNVAHVGGSRKVTAHGPGEASRIGVKQVLTKLEAKPATKPAAVPLGNEVAKNVGAGGPGKGRTVYASGSQGKHGEAVNVPRDKGSDPWRGE